MIKKVISLVSIIAMLAAQAPTVSAVMLDMPVALDKTVVVENSRIGKEGVLTTDAQLTLPETTGNYVISYPIKIVSPMAEFSLTMTMPNKASGYFVLGSYDEENGTYKASWRERSITELGTVEVGKTYNVKYEYENIGLGADGKKPMLKSLTVTDEDGNVAASGENLSLRNFSDTAN